MNGAQYFKYYGDFFFNVLSQEYGVCMAEYQIVAKVLH